MPETAQFLLCSLNYLVFSSFVEDLSYGEQNEIKETFPLVKPDFSLCRLFVMLWPHHVYTDPSQRNCSAKSDLVLEALLIQVACPLCLWIQRR